MAGSASTDDDMLSTLAARSPSISERILLTMESTGSISGVRDLGFDVVLVQKYPSYCVATFILFV